MKVSLKYYYQIGCNKTKNLYIYRFIYIYKISLTLQICRKLTMVSIIFKAFSMNLTIFTSLTLILNCSS